MWLTALQRWLDGGVGASAHASGVVEVDLEARIGEEPTTPNQRRLGPLLPSPLRQIKFRLFASFLANSQPTSTVKRSPFRKP